MKFLIILSLFFLFSCAKQTGSLICGDHKCINKAEANQYFEENLTIEVQIVSGGKESRYDLVKLNLNNPKTEIKVLKKEKINKIKELSNEEIKAKKIEIKNKKKKEQVRLNKNKESKSIKKVKKEIIKIDNKSNKIYSDICANIKKCDIDSITSYLIKISNEKDFPDITLKE